MSLREATRKDIEITGVLLKLNHEVVINLLNVNSFSLEETGDITILDAVGKHTITGSDNRDEMQKVFDAMQTAILDNASTRGGAK